MALSSHLRPFITLVSGLVLLLGAGVFSTKIIEKGFQDNSAALIDAAERKFLASEIFRLVLQQDDATKSMLISPERIGEVSEAKIAAYDKQNLLMKELQKKDGGKDLLAIITELEHLDEEILRKLDENLLESLLGGEKDNAIKIFFTDYAPAREKYGKIVEKLKKHAEDDAQQAFDEISANIKKTNSIILSTFSLLAGLFLILFVVNFKRAMVQRRNNDLQNLLTISMGMVKAKEVQDQLLVLNDHLPLQKSGHSASLWVKTPDPDAFECFVLKEGACVAQDLEKKAPSSIVVHPNGLVELPLVLGSQHLGCLTLQFETNSRNTIGLSFLESLSLSFALSAQGILDAKKRERDGRIIAKKEHDMRMVLDSMSEGLVVVDTQGAFTGLCSKAFISQVGNPEKGKALVDTLYAAPSRAKESFGFLFDQLCLDILPFDVGASQLPSRLEVRGATYEITYQPVMVEHNLYEIIVSLRDVTTQVALEAKDRANRDVLAFLELMSASPQEGVSFLNEMKKMVGDLSEHPNQPHLKRLIHTMKGSSSVVGLAAFAALCHTTEDELQEKGVLDGPALNTLVASWKQFELRIAPFVNLEKDDSVLRVTHSQLVDLLELGRNTISKMSPPTPSCVTFLENLENLFKTPIKEKVSILNRQAMATAQKLGKLVEVQEELEAIRLPPKKFDGFFSSLIHVVRNAIDHGLEDRPTRESRGKNPMGLLKLEARLDGDRFIFQIEDDGGGIQWDKVKAKALEKHLPAESHDDLVKALFSDGVSTKGEVSEYSGRGVGLAAVLAECQSLGGQVDVTSTLGKGCAFVFSFPWA